MASWRQTRMGPHRNHATTRCDDGILRTIILNVRSLSIALQHHLLDLRVRVFVITSAAGPGPPPIGQLQLSADVAPGRRPVRTCTSVRPYDLARTRISTRV